MKILVVDDQKINRTLPCVLLRQAGCDVEEVESGEAALAALRARPMDAVLLDISMPGLSGTEVCRRVRGDPALAGLFVVAYTAHALPEDRQACLDAGMDDYLSKPVDRLRLYRALRPWLPAAAHG